MQDNDDERAYGLLSRLANLERSMIGCSDSNVAGFRPNERRRFEERKPFLAERLSRGRCTRQCVAGPRHLCPDSIPSSLPACEKRIRHQRRIEEGQILMLAAFCIMEYRDSCIIGCLSVHETLMKRFWFTRFGRLALVILRNLGRRSTYCTAGSSRARLRCIHLFGLAGMLTCAMRESIKAFDSPG